MKKIIPILTLSACIAFASCKEKPQNEETTNTNTVVNNANTNINTLVNPANTNTAETERNINLQSDQTDTLQVSEKTRSNKSQDIYEMIGNVKVEKKIGTLHIAKLTDYPMFMMNFYFEGDDGGYLREYYLPTFQLDNERMTLISSIPTAYVKNATYEVKYRVLAKDYDLREDHYFDAFVKRNKKEDLPDVTYSRLIPKEVKGIIEEIRRLDNE